ncbi:MAG: transcription termination factor NusA, partial [Patescibacteria group bacterium]
MDLRSFGQAIQELAEEKGVAESKVIETIELAIAAAYKKDYGKKGQIIRARFDPASGELSFSQIKIAVDETTVKSEEEIRTEEAARHISAAAPGEVEPPKKETEESEDAAEEPSPEIKKVRFNPERHIMLEEARRIKPDAQPGEELEFPLEEKSGFGRIASQTAKQVIIQRIREAEREATYSEFKDKEGEIISGLVQRIEGRNAFLDLGRGVGVLTYEEQIPRERLGLGDRVKSLLTLVTKDPKGPGIYLSRSHPRFLKKLFELEVPEIPSGLVEIKVLAREAGSRSKIAVTSHDPAIDPVGAMVGQRGVRVSTVINEISGEKIDIIEWSDDPARFVANALAPAKVLAVEIIEDRGGARVLVPDDQLSLAIGKGGQNV